MDCARFEESLDLILIGDLTSEEDRAVAEHTAACARCRELLQIVRGELDILPMEARAELTTSILMRTSGSACRIVEERLCERLDGRLKQGEEELVQLHLRDCLRCRTLDATLSTMMLDLSYLAERSPDDRFVSDVLEATVYRRQVWQVLVERAHSWCRQQIRRPRFAVEAAFSGAILVLILFGTPSSPLRAVPPKAIEIARTNPVHSVLEIWNRNNGSLKSVASYGESTLEKGVGNYLGGPNGIGRDLAQNAGRVRDTFRISLDHLRPIPGAVWRGEFVQAWNHFSNLWNAIGDRWRTNDSIDSERETTEP